MQISDAVEHVDLAGLASPDAQDRLVQRLATRQSGSPHAMISAIRTPPGEGSPEGRHTHEVDQFFFIVSGTMHVEIDGEFADVSAGDLVRFPAGIPHQNWNRTDRPVVHLAINTPAPANGRPLAFSAPPLPAQP